MNRHAIFAACLAAVSLVAGCTTEPVQTPVPAGTKVLKAGILPTKTELQEDKTVVWSAGDQIVVNGSESAALTAGGAVATFSFEQELTAPYKAVYPASAWQDEGVVLLPAEQEKTVGNFGTGADLLYAYVTSGDEISFKHALAFLQVSVTGDAKIATIAVRGNRGEQLSGAFDIDYQTGALTEAENFSEDEVQVLAHVDAVAPTVYIAVPAREYTGGFTFTITDTEGHVMEQIKPSAKTLQAGVVDVIPAYAFEVAPEGDGSGTEDDPYLIRTAEDMKAISDKLVENETRYFKVVNNIDMTTVTDWKPVSGASPYTRRIVFDGNKKTISNLRMSGAVNYMSIFGVLNGVVKDLILKDCSSSYTGTVNTPIGLVAGWIGISNGSFDAELNDVHAVNCRVTHAGPGYVGGLGGNTNNSRIINCSFDGTVERTSTSASGYVGAGGLYGGVQNALVEQVVVEGCSTSGKLIVASGNATGGIAGNHHANAHINFKDCHSTMDITSAGIVIGGILGYCGESVFTDCSYAGTITSSNSGSSAFIGGIVPHSNLQIQCIRCHSTGEIKAPGGIIGGIIGQTNAQTSATLQEAVVQECWSTMTLTGKEIVGGLVGRAINNWPLVVSNSWYEGEIHATGQNVGGLVADAPKKSVITNSWVQADIDGGFGMGGLVGRLCGRGGGSDDYTLDTGNSMTGCIYAGSLVKSVTEGGENMAKHYSNGALIGFSSAPNTLANNYRNPGMSFSGIANTVEDVDLNALFDQADSSPSNPLVWPYTGQGTNVDGVAHPLKYWRPYHGKAYTAGQTISAIAKQIGWSENVWDLSGDKPVLRNNK